MADPNWNRGFYYDGVPPHNGMKLARRKYNVFRGRGDRGVFFWVNH